MQGDVAEVVGHLPSMPKALGSISSTTHNRHGGAHTSNLSTREVQAGRSEVQCHPQATQTEFSVSVRYSEILSRNKNKPSRALGTTSVLETGLSVAGAQNLHST